MENNGGEETVTPTGSPPQLPPFLIASIRVDKRGLAFDVDPSGTCAVVASNAIYVIPLVDAISSSTNPVEVVKVPGSAARPDLSAVAWNPHSQTLAAANKSVSVWKTSDGGTTWNVHCTMEAHRRAVTDLAWSPFRQHILATKSADCCLIWDVRQKGNALRKHTVSELGSATSGCVKWNRHNADILATTQDGLVQIWDLKKLSSPVEVLTAHPQGITDLDWDYNNETALLTASLDKSVKVWETTNLTSPKATVQVGVPVVRARYTPFGEGIVTLGRGQTTLTLWSLFNLSKPVFVYRSKQSSREIAPLDDILSFSWQTIKHTQTGRKPGNTQYHLVSWGKDRYLNIWDVVKKHQEPCFFTKALRGRSASLEEIKMVSKTLVDSDNSERTRRETTEILERIRSEIPQEERSPTQTREEEDGEDVGDPEDGEEEITVPYQAPYGDIGIHPSPPMLAVSPHAAPLLDLHQEFAFVTQHPIPKLTVEVDNIDKSCVASYIVEDEEQKVSIFLKVSFPSFYPHSPPSFQFLPETTISHQRKLMLLRGLNKIAQFNMQHSRPCLRQSLLQLVKLQDCLDEEDRQEKEAKLRAEAELVAAEQAKKEAAEEEERRKEQAMKEAQERKPEPTPSSEPGAPEAQETIQGTPESPMSEQIPFPEPDMLPPEQPRRSSLLDILKSKVKNLKKEQPEETSGEDAINLAGSPPSDYNRSESRPIGRHRSSTRDSRPKNPILAVKQELSEEAAHKAHQHQVETTPFVGSPSLSSSSNSPLSRLMGASDLLSMADFRRLSKVIPSRFSMSDWKLVYSTMQHGISLANFYRHAKGYSPTIIVVEDSNKYVFGGFMTGFWEVSLTKSNKFSGTGESFLFTMSPKFAVYKWSTINEQFMMCEIDFIALGGGHNVGLLLDAEFDNGCSKRCDTYLNHPLASAEDFSVVVVEVWGLAT